MKAFLKDWASWVSIVMSVVCFWLGSLDPIPDGSKPDNILFFLNSDFYNQFVNHKNLTVFGLVILLGIFKWLEDSSKAKNQKKWLKQFFKHLTNQHLGGGSYSTRITIFRKSRGIKLLTLRHVFFVFSKKCPFSMFPNPFKNYLTIYVRYSSVYQNDSHTFFRINSNSKREGSSLVAECFNTDKKVSCKTRSIKDIKLPKDMNSLSTPNKKRVERYMRDSHISDYDTLYTIKTPSNSLLALPIKHEDKMWGVIVFDNISEPGNDPIDFETKIEPEFLNSYQKIVQFTTQLIID